MSNIIDKAELFVISFATYNLVLMIRRSCSIFRNDTVTKTYLF